MLIRRSHHFALALALLAPGCQQADEPPDDGTIRSCPEFGYEGPTGPSAWGALCSYYELCDTGAQQSPLDLAPATPSESRPIETSYPTSGYELMNDGETIRAVPYHPGVIRLDAREYTLTQFHFHTPSEHTIGGEHFPVEMHLVHRATGGDIAVLALFVDSGVASTALQMLPAVGATTRLEDLALNDIVPADTAIYSYTGSLTTPPCTEGVSWNLVATPIEASAEQLRTLRAAIGHENARPVQAVGDRIIELLP